MMCIFTYILLICARRISMKRNWEIIREILLELEGKKLPNERVNAKDFSAHDFQEVAYNMNLLIESGFVKGGCKFSSQGDDTIIIAYIERMNSKGHDLLDTIRSNALWTKIKDKFLSKGIDMTCDSVLLVGKKIAESILLDN